MITRLLAASTMMWAASANAQDTPSFSWTALADGSQITTMDMGGNQLRRYRCRNVSSGAACLMMESYTTFGSLYLFGVPSLPTSVIRPTSGFRCSVEPGSSFSQDIYTTEAGQRVEVLSNHQARPGSPYYRRGPLWTETDFRGFADQNGVTVQSVFFDCAAAYQTATQLGGIRSLFTNQYPFPVQLRAQ